MPDCFVRQLTVALTDEPLFYIRVQRGAYLCGSLTVGGTAAFYALRGLECDAGKLDYIGTVPVEALQGTPWACSGRQDVSHPQADYYKTPLSGEAGAWTI